MPPSSQKLVTFDEVIQFVPDDSWPMGWSQIESMLMAIDVGWSEAHLRQVGPETPLKNHAYHLWLGSGGSHHVVVADPHAGGEPIGASTAIEQAMFHLERGVPDDVTYHFVFTDPDSVQHNERWYQRSHGPEERLVHALLYHWRNRDPYAWPGGLPVIEQGESRDERRDPAALQPPPARAFQEVIDTIPRGRIVSFVENHNQLVGSGMHLLYSGAREREVASTCEGMAGYLGVPMGPTSNDDLSLHPIQGTLASYRIRPSSATRKAHGARYGDRMHDVVNRHSPRAAVIQAEVAMLRAPLGSEQRPCAIDRSLDEKRNVLGQRVRELMKSLRGMVVEHRLSAEDPFVRAVLGASEPQGDWGRLAFAARNDNQVGTEGSEFDRRVVVPLYAVRQLGPALGLVERFGEELGTPWSRSVADGIRGLAQEGVAMALRDAPCAATWEQESVAVRLQMGAAEVAMAAAMGLPLPAPRPGERWSPPDPSRRSTSRALDVGVLSEGMFL